MTRIAPSLLAADFLHLSDAVDIVNRYADILHVDVMDGSFVPNISVGFPVVEAIAPASTKPLDVHLMICSPEKYASKFATIDGVGMVSFHLDASDDPESLLEEIRSHGVKAGLVINPDIRVEALFPYLEHCDFILIMSVFAGFGGQKFIETTYDRIACLRKEIDRRGLDISIEVDGGVSGSNSGKLVKSGADILVAGTAVFKAEDPAAAIASMR